MLNPKTNTIDSTVLIPNLLKFIVENQEEAFEFANPGAGLRKFETVYNNASGRVVEKFPSLCVVIDELETSFVGDLLNGRWRVRLEIAAKSDLPEEVVINLKKRADAVEKMLIDANDNLTINARQPMRAKISERAPVKSFDEVSRHEDKFVQVCTIEAEFLIITAAFKE